MGFIRFILTVVVLLFFWEGIALTANTPLFLPQPVEVVAALAANNEALSSAIVATLTKVFFAFGLSVIVGSIVGLIVGYYDWLYESLALVIDFTRSVPPTAIFPLFLLFFGIGDEAKILVTAWGGIMLMVVATTAGVRHIPKFYFTVSKSLKLKKRVFFSDILLPAVLPSVFSGMRITLSFVLLVIVALEMFIGAGGGLGKEIIESQLRYYSAEMYAAIVVTGIIGYFLSIFLLSVEQHVIHWTKK